MKEIFLTSNDNVKIAANHIQNGHNNVVIIVHGWFMTKDSKPFKQLAQCLSKDFDILSMDCRGHGRSAGLYTFTSKESQDLKCIVDYAKTQYEKIFLVGFSLGGALVLLHEAQNHDISKIISVSPPADFQKIENRFWSPNAWIPTIQKFELNTWLSIRADLKSLIFDKKPNYCKEVEKVIAPTLFIGGEKDPTVSLWHTKLLFEKAKCEKRLEIFKDGLHAEDLFINDCESFLNLCRHWFLEPKN